MPEPPPPCPSNQGAEPHQFPARHFGRAPLDTGHVGIELADRAFGRAHAFYQLVVLLIHFCAAGGGALFRLLVTQGRAGIAVLDVAPESRCISCVACSRPPIIISKLFVPDLGFVPCPAMISVRPGARRWPWYAGRIPPGCRVSRRSRAPWCGRSCTDRQPSCPVHRQGCYRGPSVAPVHR